MRSVPAYGRMLSAVERLESKGSVETIVAAMFDVHVPSQCAGAVYSLGGMFLIAGRFVLDVKITNAKTFVLLELCAIKYLTILSRHHCRYIVHVGYTATQLDGLELTVQCPQYLAGNHHNLISSSFLSINLRNTRRKLRRLVSVLSRRSRMHRRIETPRTERITSITITSHTVGVALQLWQSATSCEKAIVGRGADVVDLILVVAWVAEGKD
jgi:hypothetical protein